MLEGICDIIFGNSFSNNINMIQEEDKLIQEGLLPPRLPKKKPGRKVEVLTPRTNGKKDY